MPRRLLRRFVLAGFALASPVFAQAQIAQAPPTGQAAWKVPFEPVRIIGNLYYVGTYDLAVYLIATPQGNILINSGLADSAPLIKASIERLGFKYGDTKLMLATHAHYDHAAALAQIKEETGAKFAANVWEVALFEDGGHSDYLHGPEGWFPPVKVDQVLHDGDKVGLGGVEITAHLHAGHTRGATSYSMNVVDGGRTYRVLIANLGSINPGTVLVHNTKYPAIADDYARTFRDQEAPPCDIFLASHASQFELHKKYQPGDAYKPERFVDPQGYQQAVAALQNAFLAELAKQNAKK